MKLKSKTAELLHTLERRHAALEQQVEDLSIIHSSLVLKHTMLTAWCESLAFLQSRGPVTQLEATLEAKGYLQLEQLQEREQELLQQLQQLEAASQERASSFSDASAPRADPLLENTSPPGDPMQYFRQMVARPLLLEVENWSSLQLAEHYRSMVLELAVQVALLAGPPAIQQAALQRIKDTLDRYFHVLTSLILMGKQDLMQSLLTYNIDTLESLRTDPTSSSSSTASAPASAASDEAAGTEAAADQSQQAILEFVVPELNLTPEQEECIAQGMEQCTKMLRPIIAEWQQLQQQIHTHTTGTSSDSGDRVASTSRGALLQAQQEHSARLKIVMQKNFLMLFAGIAWFVGCLTWPQVAKVFVLRWPYSARLTQVGLAVKQQREERLQQQLQQREHQRQQHQRQQASRRRDRRGARRR